MHCYNSAMFNQMAFHNNHVFALPQTSFPPLMPLNYQVLNPATNSSCSSNNDSRRQIKHKFTQEEDEKLTQIVNELGDSNWKRIADKMGTRNCRQCRERWKNYLCPSVSKTPWTADEDELLQQKYKELGSQWSIIAKFFPNRTDVNLKNRWVVLTSHTVQEKRVRRSKQTVSTLKMASISPSSSTNQITTLTSVCPTPDELPNSATASSPLSSGESSNDESIQSGSEGEIISDDYFEFDFTPMLDNNDEDMNQVFDFDNTGLFCF
ncbi:Myb-like DNA-binding domain containing protein [Tritrichomonas foetus]|uniref:Myb-like DNA-binding domain containing protein n=1 Tax=Tritrichomonas foetus TaxID=1144522 RepID=A0A1J4JIC1_9EUKA|nr:Myb-like DNA-binding domain containing protein [Tritrichomonas foetus]|eukprot:OHS98441.1 Myb-like DNA-binding domain containing protein [Tritrichomonas foetus]